MKLKQTIQSTTHQWMQEGEEDEPQEVMIVTTEPLILSPKEYQELLKQTTGHTYTCSVLAKNKQKQ